MSCLKNQIAQLKKDLNQFDRSFPVIILDNGKEIKVRPKDLTQALCSIATINENYIVKALNENEIIRYTGKGNIPQLIKSIIESMKLYDRD